MCGGSGDDNWDGRCVVLVMDFKRAIFLDPNLSKSFTPIFI
jgi:hypothetical protein